MWALSYPLRRNARFADTPSIAVPWEVRARLRQSVVQHTTARSGTSHERWLRSPPLRSTLLVLPGKRRPRPTIEHIDRESDTKPDKQPDPGFPRQPEHLRETGDGSKNGYPWQPWRAEWTLEVRSGPPENH